MQTIMIVEDDQKIAEHIKLALEKYGFTVFVTSNFENVLKDFLNIEPSLVLLDINLPHYDGYFWCRQIRKQSICPVIFLSARIGEMDQVMALENGGDDFMTKPFHTEVLIAKIKSQLRRAYGEYAQQKERSIEVSGLRIYPERLTLTFKGKTLALTKNESYILEILLERYPRVAGREDLLHKLWDDEAFVDENTLNVNITRVRKKLEHLWILDAVATVRGAGYVLKVTWE
ncbi:putative two-component response regulator [Bacillus sp. TS-2]|nr:putative two-component response regulator [Bacillus sp. TS-2]